MQLFPDPILYDQFMAVKRTFLLMVAAGAQQRAGGPFTAAQYAQAARKVGEAHGYVDADIPVASDVPRIMGMLCEKGVAEPSSKNRWQLTEKGSAIVLEMSDEHTEDIFSLHSFLGEHR